MFTDSVNKLPGEHGFHTRDGSLTKKKREQWEKERAESTSPWFPFGSAGARAYVPKSQSSDNSSEAQHQNVYPQYGNRDEVFYNESQPHYDQREDRGLKDPSLDEQIKERLRMDELLAEQERRELRALKQIHDSQERKHEEEAAEEARKQQKIQEAMDAKERVYRENMEKARIESEVLRKAKLYKHVLLDAETTDETIRNVLGTNDADLVRKALKQLGALERQKRIDLENFHHSPGASGSASSPTQTPASAARTTPNQSAMPSSSSAGKPRPAQRRFPAMEKNSSHQLVSDDTPLTRSGVGRASLRVSGSPKQSATSSTKRRSGSAERLNTSSKQSPSAATNNKGFDKGSGGALNSAGRSKTTPQNGRAADLRRNEPPTSTNFTRQSHLAQNSKLHISSQNYHSLSPELRNSQQQPPQPLPRRLFNTKLPAKSSDSTAAMTTCSSTSVNSCSTVIVGDSPFMNQLPRISDLSRRNGVQQSGGSNSSNETSHGESDLYATPQKTSPATRNGKTLPPTPPPKPKNYNSPAERAKENEKNGEVKNESPSASSVLHVDTGVQYNAEGGAFSVEQRFGNHSIPFMLRQYESMLSNFSPILPPFIPRSANASVVTNAAAGVFHAEAKRYLSGLPADNEQNSKSSASTRSLKQNIGLFEPVKTRQKMRQDPCNNSISPKNFTELGQNGANNSSLMDVDEEDLHHRRVKFDRQEPKGSSVGASSIVTNSPVSSSPPLSSGCKSTSPFENHTTGGVSSPEPSRKNSEVERIMNGNAFNENSQCDKLNGSSTLKAFITGASGCSQEEDFSSSGSCGSSNGTAHHASRKDIFNGGNSFAGRLPPPAASPFAMKLAESGSRRHPCDNLHVDSLRRNLRSPTMKRLQESLGNLSVADEKIASSGNESGGENSANESFSRPITPKPFNCRTMQYRSLNMKGKSNAERQQRILDQLAQVRAQLKDRQQKIERTFSSQNLAGHNGASTPATAKNDGELKC